MASFGGYDSRVSPRDATSRTRRRPALDRRALLTDLETAASRDLLAWIGRVTVSAWAEYTTRSGGRVAAAGGLTYLVGSHPTPIIINTVFRTDAAIAPADVFTRGLFVQSWYRIPDSRKIHVNGANLTRFTLHETHDAIQ